jgi:hypothetical protein
VKTLYLLGYSQEELEGNIGEDIEALASKQGWDKQKALAKLKFSFTNVGEWIVATAWVLGFSTSH